MTGVGTTTEFIHRDDAETPTEYAGFLSGVRHTFTTRTAPVHRDTRALFRVDAPDLWLHYITNLNDQQTHTCRACAQFIERYGGLVVVNDDGSLTSALWEPEQVPFAYRRAVAAMKHHVESHAFVQEAFLTPDDELGLATTPDLKRGVTWHHLNVHVPVTLRYRGRKANANQYAAAIREDVTTVQRALEEFSPEALHEANRILTLDALSRSERFVAPVRWLLYLSERLAAVRSPFHRHNLLWLAVATAPEGYRHPRASAAGRLLDMIAERVPFPEIERRWKEMLHPLHYQRPQEAPAAGNLVRAEKLVEQMGLAPALRRRFARLPEVIRHARWRPRHGVGRTGDATPTSGIFAGITPKRVPAFPKHGMLAADVPRQTVTWEKFRRDVLPHAEAIELHVPATRFPWIALTTAADPDAPPIIRWDREGERNPVAWFCYVSGMDARTAGLPINGWVKVTAILPHPNLWGSRPTPHHAEGDIIVLDGCRDGYGASGSALFPEFLKDDLREVRATIEAHSTRTPLEERDGAAVCGWDVRKSQSWMKRPVLRVAMMGAVQEYTIDRWD